MVTPLPRQNQPSGAHHSTPETIIKNKINKLKETLLTGTYNITKITLYNSATLEHNFTTYSKALWANYVKLTRIWNGPVTPQLVPD